MRRSVRAALTARVAPATPRGALSSSGGGSGSGSRAISAAAPLLQHEAAAATSAAAAGAGTTAAGEPQPPAPPHRHAPLLARGAPGVRERVAADLRAEYPVRAEILAASSARRSAISVATVAALQPDRIMAHMLLVNPDVAPGDMANPGRWSSITYDDLEAAAEQGGDGALAAGDAARPLAALGADGVADAAALLTDGESGASSSGSDSAGEDLMDALASAERGGAATRGRGGGGGGDGSMSTLFDQLLEGVPSSTRGGADAAVDVAAGGASEGELVGVDEDEAGGGEEEADAGGRPVFGVRVPAGPEGAGFDPTLDASPCILGGFALPSALVAHSQRWRDGGEAPPSHGEGAQQALAGELSPLATTWLDAVIGHLHAVVARLRVHVATAPQAAASAAAPGGGGAAALLVPFEGPVDGAHAEAALAALTAIPAAPLPPATRAWLAALPQRKLASLMTHLLLRRRGLAVPLGGGAAASAAAAPGDFIRARIAALTDAAEVLAAARDGRLRAAAATTAPAPAGSEPPQLWPTLKALHGALAGAVGSGVPVFTPLRSAAAALASRFSLSLSAEQVRLDGAVQRAAAMRAAFLAGAGMPAEDAALPPPRFVVAVPSRDALLRAPDFAADAVTVDVQAGRGVSPQDAGPVTVHLALPHTHARLLNAGHIPSALAPLALLLTPAEHAAAVSLAIMAQPGLRENLARGPASVAAAAAGAAPAAGAGAGELSDGSGLDDAAPPPTGIGSDSSSLADLLDHLARSRNSRRLLAAEEAVVGALDEALDELAADSSSLPPGFDLPAWRDYVTWCLELRSGGLGEHAFEGREGVVSALLRASLDTLPPGVRARLVSAHLEGADPVRGAMDAAGVTAHDVMRASAALAAQRSGLTSDAQALLAASGAGVPDASGLGALPLDSSAGVLSSASAWLSAGGPDAAEAAGGTSLPRPVVQQYYPRTRAVYAADGTTVLRHVPLATRLAEDLSGTGAVPDSPWVGDEVEADVLDGIISRSLGALAGECAAGDIAGEIAAHKRAAALARLSDKDRELVEEAEAEAAAAAAAAPPLGGGGAGAVGGAGGAAGGGAAAFTAALRASVARRAAQDLEVTSDDFGRGRTGGGSDASSGADVALALARVPKPVTPASLAAHAEALATGSGGVVPEPSPRLRSRARSARRARSDVAHKALLDEAAERGIPATELLDATRPWDDFGYAPKPDYREPASYSLLHTRLLEAADARDLEAMFALWHAHTRMAPQEGAPDFLAVEILMDACARAGRWDLLHGYLWRTVNRLQMKATPPMLFAMLKALALRGDHAGAHAFVKLMGKQDVPVEAHHYVALVSAALLAGDFPAAFEHVNSMRKRGMPTPASTWAAMFKALHAAGRKEECHYVWNALTRATTLRVPLPLYTQIICMFAEQGNLDDMQLARDRLGERRQDGRHHPEPAALLAMLRAYTAAGPQYVGQAAEVLGEVRASPLFAHEGPEGAALREAADKATGALRGLTAAAAAAGRARELQ